MGDKTHEVDEDITWCTPGILQTEEIKTLLGYFTCYLKKKPDYEVLCLMIDETHIPQDDLEERKVIDYPKVERKMEKMSVLLEDAAFWQSQEKFAYFHRTVDDYFLNRELRPKVNVLAVVTPLVVDAVYEKWLEEYLNRDVISIIKMYLLEYYWLKNFLLNKIKEK